MLRIFRRGNSPYQPAVARIEGGGIKRGLTAPEAAVVLGKPLNITLTLVIFEMLRKGFLRQVGATPLVVEVAEAFRTRSSGLSAQARSERRRKAAQAIHAALHKYEEPFLELIESNPGTPVHELDFGVAVQPLVRYVAGRVGGFNLDETRTYYRLLIERAPREARSDGKLTFERQKIFDRNFGIVLLGEDFEEVLDQDDFSYVPVWQRTSGGLGVEGSRGQTPPLTPSSPRDMARSGQAPPLGKGSVENQMGNLPPGRSFARWTKDVMTAMEGVVDERDVKLTLGGEMDEVSATLLNEIARATFYG